MGFLNVANFIDDNSYYKQRVMRKTLLFILLFTLPFYTYAIDGLVIETIGGSKVGTGENIEKG